MNEEEWIYCTQKARAADVDAYLAALFLPEPERRRVLALDALAAELGGAKRPHEPLLALMRVQWWREAIKRAFSGRPDAHPVLQALSVVIAQQKLPEAEFESLLQAHEKDLEAEEAGKWSATAAARWLLQLKHWALTGGPGDETASRVLDATSVALGAGVVLRRKDGGDVSDLVQHAEAAIITAKAHPGAVRLPLLLPLSSLKLYLNRLKRVPEARAQEPPVYQKQWAMLRARLRGRL